MSRRRFPVKPPVPKPAPPVPVPKPAPKPLKPKPVPVPKPPKPVPAPKPPKPPVPQPGGKVGRTHPSIRARTARIAARYAQTGEDDAEGGVDVGNELIAIKESLARGQWEAWVDQDAPLDIRVAQRLMRLARWATAHRAWFVAHKKLGSSKLHLIAIQKPEIQRAVFGKKTHRVDGHDEVTLGRLSYRDLWKLIGTLRPPKRRIPPSDVAQREYNRALMSLKDASKKVIPHAGVIDASRAEGWREALLELVDDIEAAFALPDA